MLGACGGGSSSTGQGGGSSGVGIISGPVFYDGVQLTANLPQNGDILIFVVVGSSCTGAYDIYSHLRGRLYDKDTPATGLVHGGSITDTVAPGNHLYQLVIVGTHTVVATVVVKNVTAHRTVKLDCI